MFFEYWLLSSFIGLLSVSVLFSLRFPDFSYSVSMVVLKLHVRGSFVVIKCYFMIFSHLSTKKKNKEKLVKTFYLTH